MTLRIKSAKISGSPSERGWSQCYECTLQNDAKGKAFQQLFVVFTTIKESHSVEDARLGRDFLMRLCELYSQNTSEGAIALKDAVNKVFEEYFAKLDGLEIAAAVYLHNVLYTVCINGGKTTLYRDGFLVGILDSNSPKTISASGFPKEGDIVILATGKLFEYITRPQIKNILSNGVDRAEDELSVKLQAISAVGVILMNFSSQNASWEKADTEDQIPPDGNTELPDKKHTGPTFANNMISKIRTVVSRRRIYLRRQITEAQPEKSRKTLFAGIILTALLAISVLFGIYKNRQEEYEDTYSSRLSQAETDINEALGLKEVDVKRSRELFLKGRAVLNNLKDEGIKDEKIDNLLKTVLDNEAQILGEKRPESDLWLDLTLITDNFQSEALSFNGNEIVVMDTVKNILLIINTDSKRSETEKIPGEIAKPLAVVNANTGIYLYDATGGIFDFSKGSWVTKDNYGLGVRIFVYASNIYVLDEDRGQIVKFNALDDGFSEGKKWTTSDSEDFALSRSFVIDGWVWVLMPNAGLAKYSYGNKISFELKGYPYEMPDYDRLYTNEESENLYLMDSESGTISVFDKDGEYKTNFIADVIKEGKDFIVLEKEGRILLLTGGKVYEVGIE